MTAVFVLLWLISSSAWADAVSKVKTYTDPKEYFTEDYACECSESKSSACAPAEKCEVTRDAGFATLNVSIVSWHIIMSTIFQVNLR